MRKLKHFAAKLRQTRARLGMKQKDLAIALGNENLRGLIARWESPLEKNRSFPKPEYLHKIANLTAQPWQTLCWFANDAIDATDGYDIDSSGNFVVAQRHTDDEINAMYEAHFNDITERQKPASVIKKLTEPGNFKDLIAFYEHRNAEEAKGEAAIEEATEQLRSGLTKNDFKDIAKRPKTIEAIPSGRVEIVGDLNKDSSGMVLRAPPTIGDVAPGPSYVKKTQSTEKKKVTTTILLNSESQDERLRGLRSVHDDRMRDRQVFWGGVQFLMQDLHKIDDPRSYFEKRVSKGEISHTCDYLDGATLAEFIEVHPESTGVMLRTNLKRALSSLFMAERVINRSYKKLILVYCPSSGQINSEELANRLSGLVNSASMLGVAIRFSCGMSDTANLFGQFVREAATV